MRYTLRSGVERRFSNRFGSNFRFGLPLVLALLILTWAVLHSNNSRINHKPLTLGIYTIKSPNNSGSNNSKSGNSNTSKNNKDTTASGSIPGASPTGTNFQPAATIGGGGSGGSLSSTVGSVQGTTTTGGQGGGSGGGTSGGGGGTVTPPPPPTSTVTCNNTGGVLPMTCTACAPPLLVPVGQKVLLYSTGSCTLIN